MRHERNDRLTQKRYVATWARAICMACVLATTAGCTWRDILVEIVTVFGLVEGDIIGCADPVGFGTDLDVVGTKRNINEMYRMWNQLDRAGYDAPPLVGSVGGGYRTNSDGTGSYISVDARGVDVHIAPKISSWCEFFYSFDCSGDNILACFTTENDLGMDPLVPMRKIRGLLYEYRDGEDIRELGLSYVAGTYHHETMHKHGGHTAGKYRDANPFWVYGAGYRTGVKTASDVWDAARSGQEDFANLFTAANLLEFRRFYDGRQWALQHSAVDNTGGYAELEAVAHPDFLGDSGPRFGDYIASLRVTPSTYCGRGTAPDIEEGEIDGGRACVTKQAVRFTDPQGQPASGRVAIVGPSRVLLTPSEVQDQVAMDSHFAARDEYRLGRDGPFEAYSQEDWAPANYCAHYGYGWRLLTELEVDRAGDGFATPSPSFAQLIEDNQTILRYVRVPSYDHVIDPMRANRYGASEPVFYNIERKGVAESEMNGYVYPGNVASVALLSYDAMNSGETLVDLMAVEDVTPDHNFMVYEPDEPELAPNGFFIHDDVLPAEQGGLTGHRALTTDPSASLSVRQYAARVMCFKPLPGGN